MQNNDQNSNTETQEHSQPGHHQPDHHHSGHHSHHPTGLNILHEIGGLFLGGTPNERFFKGVLIGAAVTYVLTHEQVQRSLIKTALQSYEFVAAAVEEWKEKVRDAQAELNPVGSQTATRVDEEAST